MNSMQSSSRALVLFAAAALASCSQSESPAGWERPGARAETATRVIVETVRFEADTDRIQAVGTARAKSTAEIYPETNGEVVSVNFGADGKVERGQVLVRLEARAEELAVRRAEVAVRDAQQLLDRYARIDVPGAISDSQVDTAETALEAARIDLDLARNTLAQRTVRAPFSGYVGLPSVDPGARVTTQTMITRLDDRSLLYVDFAAPEQVFGGIAPGDTLAMEPFTLSGGTVEATVVAIDSGIDPVTRSFTVRASVDNSDDSLRPGMSFRVNFDLPGQSYPTVPETSILWGGDGSYLWSVVDDRAVQTPVDIVARKQGRVLVRGELTPASRIIIEGVQKVRPGSLLDPETADGERGAATAAASGGAIGDVLQQP